MHHDTAGHQSERMMHISETPKMIKHMFSMGIGISEFRTSHLHLAPTPRPTLSEEEILLLCLKDDYNKIISPMGREIQS